MQYKVRYRPLERLTREGWQRMDRQEQHRLIAAATAPRQEQDAALSGARGKDGQPVKLTAS
jgi:arginine-tRNA-protein transferase